MTEKRAFAWLSRFIRALCMFIHLSLYKFYEDIFYKDVIMEFADRKEEPAALNEAYLALSNVIRFLR